MNQIFTHIASFYIAIVFAFFSIVGKAQDSKPSIALDDLNSVLLDGVTHLERRSFINYTIDYLVGVSLDPRLTKGDRETISLLRRTIESSASVLKSVEMDFDSEVAKQREIVWNAFDSVKENLSWHAKLESRFRLRLLSYDLGGIVFDLNTLKALGFKKSEVDVLLSNLKEIRRQYEEEMNSAKLSAIQSMWSSLTNRQQLKFLSLLGLTEKAFIKFQSSFGLYQLRKDYSGALRGTLSRKILANPIRHTLLDSGKLLEISKFELKKKKAISNGDANALLQLVNRLKLFPEIGKFPNKHSHANFLKQFDLKILPLLNHLEVYPTKQSVALHKELTDLREQINGFEEPSQLMEDLKIPKMIYSLSVHKELETKIELDDVLWQYMSDDQVDPENYFPFRPDRSILGDDSDDAVKKQVRELTKLEDDWFQEHGKTMTLKQRIILNNKYLTRTKRLLLPSQQSYLFRRFFCRLGLLMTFHHPTVAKDFKVSRSQQQRMRLVGLKASEKLNKSAKDIRRTYVEKFFNLLEKNGKSKFATAFGVRKSSLVDFYANSDRVLFVKGNRGKGLEFMSLAFPAVEIIE